MFETEKEAVWRFVRGTEPVSEGNLTYWFNHVMPQMTVKTVLDEMLKDRDLFLHEGKFHTKPQKWEPS